MATVADPIDSRIKTAMLQGIVLDNLMELGALRYNGVSKEEYIEFVKRNLKEFTAEVIETLGEL